MTVLNDGEFELDGYAFGGASHGVVVPPGGFDPGSHESRSQDAPSPNSDSLRFGRDYRTPGAWTFTLATNADTEAQALGSLEDLQVVWDNAESRTVPGSLSTMRYVLAGRTRRVYGRPRRFAPALPTTHTQGLLTAVADFQLADTLVYDDEARSTVVSAAPPVALGLTSPITTPISVASGGEREGAIADVGGKVPAPVVILFTAGSSAITSPWVATPDWRIELNTTIPAGMSVVVDTRPASMSVLRSDGANLAGKLTRTSTLQGARLKPGSAQLTFGGYDPSATATCAVSWRPAYLSL